MTPTTSDELKQAVECELSVLGMAADCVEAHCFGHGEWSVFLQVGARKFEIGWVCRDGWCCTEITPGHQKEFVSPDVQLASRDYDRLRREGLAMIKYAVENPSFEGVTRPVI